MAKVKKSTETAAMESKGKRAASAPAIADEAPVKAGKNTGRTSGLRIGEYQNQTMAQQAKRRLTDEELGEDWSTEFPEARCQFRERMDIVRVVRRLYNLGKHNNDKPATPVAKYELHNGRRVEVEEAPTGRGRKAASSPSKAA